MFPQIFFLPHMINHRKNSNKLNRKSKDTFFVVYSFKKTTYDLIRAYYIVPF